MRGKDTVVFDTGTPRLDAKDGFYLSWIKHREQLGQTIMEHGKDPSNPTIQLMVLYGITSIPDPDERHRIIEVIEEAIDDNLNEDMDSIQRAKLINKIYITVGMGACQDWYDNFVAIIKKNVWGVVNTKRTKEYGYDDEED